MREVNTLPCHQCKHRLSALLCGQCPMITLTGEHRTKRLDEGRTAIAFMMTCPGILQDEKYELVIFFNTGDPLDEL